MAEVVYSRWHKMNFVMFYVALLHAFVRVRRDILIDRLDVFATRIRAQLRAVRNSANGILVKQYVVRNQDQ